MKPDNNLKNRTATAIIWSALDKGGVKFLQIAVYVLLARLLAPEDFGLIGMLTIFIAISTMFIDSGFSQALVHNNNPSQSDYSTAFFFNIGVGIGCYLILFFLAPLVAEFYDMPLLTNVLRVISLTLITNSMTVVQRAKLLINLDFKTQSAVNLSTTVLSGSVALWAAYNDFGVWALVIQTVGTGVLSMVFYWIGGRWMPSWTFSSESFRRLFSYGSKLLASGVVAVITSNIYNIVIGKVYRAKELGYFTTGRQIADMSAGTINEVINAVTFPVLSSVKEDKQRFISIYSRMLEMTAFIVVPSMTLLAVLMHPLVLVFMTEKWLPAVFIIQCFCVAKMLMPISALNMNILKAYGRSDLFMKLDFSKLPIILIIMAITLPISVEAVAIGVIVDTVICYFMNAYLPGKLFGLGVKAQTKVFYKIFIATAVMALIVGLAIYLINNPVVKLIVGFLLGIPVYWIICKRFKVDALVETQSLLHNLYRKITHKHNDI